MEVIETVKDGFPETSPRIKSSIKKAAPCVQVTPTNKNHLHNHQIISPASETARFGGSTVPLCACAWGDSRPLGRLLRLGSAPVSPAPASPVRPAGAL